MWGIIIGYMALVRLLTGNQMTLGQYLFGWPIILLVGVRLDRQHEFDLKEIKANITAQYTKNRPYRDQVIPASLVKREPRKLLWWEHIIGPRS